MKDGFLNLLKPPGMSSHDMVGAVRKCLGIKRVGHAGTLDPAAAGILPIAVGRAARFVEYLADCDKSYRAELLLGFSTDSGDDTGNVTERREHMEVPEPAEFERTLRKFTGHIRQVPPNFSAIKLDGKRACDLARRNMEVDIPARQVEIRELSLLEMRKGPCPVLLLDVTCSKGTYIRTLCTDIGKAMGLPSTMGFLLRTRVGGFRLEDALTLEELQALGENALLAPDGFLLSLPRYDLAPERKHAFCNGLPTHDRRFEAETGKLRVYAEGTFLGIGRFDRKEQMVSPVKVYWEKKIDESN